MKINTFILISICIVMGIAVHAQSTSGIKVKVNARNGDYTIVSRPMRWTFSGSINHPLSELKNTKGKDRLGNYQEIKFQWKDQIPYIGDIKWYMDSPVILFSFTLPNGSVSAPNDFPAFTKFPSAMHGFSYGEKTFSPPQFKLNASSTPWLFFNNKADAFVISPASDFMVSMLRGDGQTSIRSGMNQEIKNLPKGFTHSTILTFGNGIQQTWNNWGEALRSIYDRRRPDNDGDTILKYFGYWTDNGGDYYYNYDTIKGYASTLNSLRERYSEEGIPLGYMQLDSWWYEKSIYDPNGKPDADHKNPKLPSGPWNRYGGLMSYTADPFLFPNGLAAFQRQLGLPLVTHNRWIDPHSPYHSQYKIAGFAAVDPNFWNDIIGYIKSSGVICYEQDWLNYIYEKSPQMAEDINVGNAFTDEMANACKANGLSIQYCMATPRFFLQGVKYNSLTTIRTSGDRFKPAKWKKFIYTSQLAYEMGIWPWSDVFMSSEKGNMILSLLSAGPVGTGDAVGKEDKENILMACRKDGVLVKPDRPILPIDQDYLNDAFDMDVPTLAYTYTQHNDFITDYVFAFATPTNRNLNFTFSPSKLGQHGKVAVFAPQSKQIHIIDASESFKGLLPETKYDYFIIAPFTKNGIAFLGDSGKIVATGKKRIAAINESNGSLYVKVLFAKGETEVVLQGYSERPVVSDRGNIQYDSKTHMFTLSLPSNGKQEVTLKID